MGCSDGVRLGLRSGLPRGRSVLRFLVRLMDRGSEVQLNCRSWWTYETCSMAGPLAIVGGIPTPVAGRDGVTSAWPGATSSSR